MFPWHVIAEGPREAAVRHVVPKTVVKGRPVISMRSTNRWVGCPAVARAAAGLAHAADLSGAAFSAAAEIDTRPSVGLKPFPARSLEEQSP